MTDPRVQRLAKVVVGYSLDLQPGKLVLIQSPSLAEPLVAELVKEILAAGAHPRTRIVAPGVEHAFISEATDEQLSYLPPFSMEEMDAIDSRIAVHAADNTRELSGIDPSKLRLRQEAHGPVMERYMTRSAAGDLTWCVGWA